MDLKDNNIKEDQQIIIETKRDLLQYSRNLASAMRHLSEKISASIKSGRDAPLEVKKLKELKQQLLPYHYYQIAAGEKLQDDVADDFTLNLNIYEKVPALQTVSKQDVIDIEVDDKD